jgi:murein DD-endopeptidase MepM/ murein hydrolase activator NlpD
VTVKSTPPRITAGIAQHYIQQGGSDAIAFQVSEDAAESGVRVGSREFRAWALPGGGPGARFALFALPHDAKPDTEPSLFARDVAGNEATATFACKLLPRKFRSRRVDLTDDFMKKVTGEILSQTKSIAPAGGLLQDFLAINRTLRQENNLRLADLSDKTQPRFLWSKPFRQLGGSQVEAEFADRRVYVYKGEKVDEQDHLGFDLAVTANVAVAAANDGQVVYAGYLGIYGNCVVIDHGYGLQSAYGHLSAIGVKAGDSVRQDQEIGRSGSTGLAGGDHLHFSMQVDGVQVNPVEWWDGRWIRDRIAAKFPEKKLPGS